MIGLGPLVFEGVVCFIKVDEFLPLLLLDDQIRPLEDNSGLDEAVFLPDRVGQFFEFFLLLLEECREDIADRDFGDCGVVSGSAEGLVDLDFFSVSGKVDDDGTDRVVVLGFESLGVVDSDLDTEHVCPALSDLHGLVLGFNGG